VGFNWWVFVLRAPTTTHQIPWLHVLLSLGGLRASHTSYYFILISRHQIVTEGPFRVVENNRFSWNRRLVMVSCHHAYTVAFIHVTRCSGEANPAHTGSWYRWWGRSKVKDRPSSTKKLPPRGPTGEDPSPQLSPSGPQQADNTHTHTHTHTNHPGGLRIHLLVNIFILINCMSKKE